MRAWDPKEERLCKQFVSVTMPIPSRNQTFTGPSRRQAAGLGHGSTPSRAGKIDPQSPLGRRRLCDVEKSVWISIGDEQQRSSCTRRRAAPLLPVLQCPD